LMSYGSGAVMSVPAHDQRDFEFAQKYGLPIKQVIRPTDGQLPDNLEAAFVDKGVLVNSGEFTALTSQQAFVAIAEYLKARGLNLEGPIFLNLFCFGLNGVQNLFCL